MQVADRKGITMHSKLNEALDVLRVQLEGGAPAGTVHTRKDGKWVKTGDGWERVVKTKHGKYTITTYNDAPHAAYVDFLSAGGKSSVPLNAHGGEEQFSDTIGKAEVEKAIKSHHSKKAKQVAADSAAARDAEADHDRWLETELRYAMAGDQTNLFVGGSAEHRKGVYAKMYKKLQAKKASK